MRLEILSRGEKKELQEKLENQFGISKLNYLFIKSGKEKIRGYSGNLSKDEIKKLSLNLRIEGIGLYLFKEENEGIRLSIDATHLIKATKGIIEIGEEQAEKWMKGESLEIDKNLKGIFIVKFKDYFLGCGKTSEGNLYNFVPKERRVKK